MTLLIAMDHVKAGRAGLDDPVRVSTEASRMTGSRVYLHAGEVQSLEQLLKAVAIAGANDAAVAVAEFIAGSESAFVGMMNERAHELGMADSRFANAHGLPPAEWEGEAKTTALDIAKAARALITFHPRCSNGLGAESKGFETSRCSTSTTPMTSSASTKASTA